MKMKTDMMMKMEKIRNGDGDDNAAMASHRKKNLVDTASLNDIERSGNLSLPLILQ